MKLKLICLLVTLGVVVKLPAQKKNYLNIETGGFYGNANQNIEQGMRNSGFDDKSTGSFWGLFSWSTQYPTRHTDNTFYRIRAGHFIKNKMSIEGGYGLSYGGTVNGYDEGSGGGNYLTIDSKIKSFEIALIITDSTKRVGFGIGPVFNFYSLKTRINYEEPTTKNSFLPGLMATSYVNIFSRKSWFLGLRTGVSFTSSARIAELNINGTGSNPKSSTFKSTKAGSFNGYVSLQAGIRFTNK